MEYFSESQEFPKTKVYIFSFCDSRVTFATENITKDCLKQKHVFSDIFETEIVYIPIINVRANITKGFTPGPQSKFFITNWRLVSVSKYDTYHWCVWTVGLYGEE